MPTIALSSLCTFTVCRSHSSFGLAYWMQHSLLSVRASIMITVYEVKVANA